MRVLVTGGAGFLGSHLCERLLSEGHQVLCYYNLITGDLENIRAFRDDSRFEFVNHNVSRYIDVAGPLDWVMHLASPASPVDYVAHPIATMKAGSLGTLNCLGLA